MANSEKTENDTTADVAEKKHVDGTVDWVSTEALGGEIENLPPGHFWNPQFIGTVVVSVPDGHALYRREACPSHPAD